MENAMRNPITSTERTDFNAFVEAAGAVTALETTEQIGRRCLLDEMLNEALMNSFPASDPISSLQLA
jgi:hypothetical protein